MSFKPELIEPKHYQKLTVDVLSRGSELTLSLGETALEVKSKNDDLSFELSPSVYLFTHLLLSNLDKDFLSSEIKQTEQKLKNENIGDLYNLTTGSIGANSARDIFQTFGSGNAKRYVALRNSNDPSRAIKLSRDRVNDSDYRGWRKAKQMRAYDELELFHSGSESRIYSKKKIATAAALAITISVGGTSYYIHKKSK